MRGGCRRFPAHHDTRQLDYPPSWWWSAEATRAGTEPPHWYAARAPRQLRGAGAGPTTRDEGGASNEGGASDEGGPSDEGDVTGEGGASDEGGPSDEGDVTGEGSATDGGGGGASDHHARGRRGTTGQRGREPDRPAA